MVMARQFSSPTHTLEHFQAIPSQLRAEPFLKWAGSKKRLLPAYDALFPQHFDGYLEPFLGGGAPFLYLASIGRLRRSILSDINSELIHLYRVLRDDVERLIAELETYPYEAEFYSAVRAKEPQELPDVERAARMMYLNRTCFNGLYRVNRSGHFNVPIGRYDNPVICNAQNLRNVSRLLQGVELQRWGFETTLEVARPGDFVFLDPPSQPIGPVSDDEFEEEAFDPADDQRLFELFRDLDERGCLVMLAQKVSPAVRQRYAGYDMRDVRLPGPRKERSRTGELVIRNY